jgi:hypothetical protein
MMVAEWEVMEGATSFSSLLVEVSSLVSLGPSKDTNTNDTLPAVPNLLPR